MSDHPEPWAGPIKGCYISDAAATSTYLSKSGHFNERQVEILSLPLGKTMVAELDNGSWTISRDPDFVRRHDPPQVLRRGRDFLITRSYDKLWQHTSKCRVIQDGDGFWVVPSKLLPHYRERFRPMTTEAFREATRHLTHNPDGTFVESEYTEDMLQQAKTAKRQLARRRALRLATTVIVCATALKGLFDLLRDYFP